jgi:exopolysaccharide biosynthesis polyprenyl glycosylphosphotransferase
MRMIYKLGETLSALADDDSRNYGDRASDRTVPDSRQDTWQRIIRTLLIASDSAVVVATVCAAQVLRFGLDDVAPGYDPLTYLILSSLLAAAWLAALSMTQSRVPAVLGIGSEEYRRVTTATLSVFGALAIVSMLLKLDVARGYIAIALPLGLLGLVSSRRLLRIWLLGKRRAGAYSDRALLIGHRADVAFVAEQIYRRPAAGYQVCGAILDERNGSGESPPPVTTASGRPVDVVGRLDNVVGTLQEMQATAVIVAGNVGNNRHFLKSLGWELEKTRASLVLASRLTDIAGPRIHWRPIDGLPLMSVELPQYTGAKHSMKRFMDVLLSFLGLIALAPIFLIVGLLIRREDGGPIFYRQPRVGVQGREFMMHKFRSMSIDADSRVGELADLNEGHGTLFKIRNDPRVTRIGSFLRKYSIDELPQLWDVLRGSMSMVGPRPPLPREVAMYEDHIHRRLNVRPGITGLWQVSGRSDLSWDESVRLDLYYVENWSPAGDMAIMFKTVKAVIAKDGAY